MESSEIIVQEMVDFASSVENALALLQAGRMVEAQSALQQSLASFKSACNKNSTMDALATLMQGFKPPTTQDLGMPAMHNPL